VTDPQPISEFDRVLAEIARKRLGGTIPPPSAATAVPAVPAVPGPGPSSIFAGPISTAAEPRMGESDVEETWEDTALTEAEATIAPNAEELAADATPAVGASAVHPEVRIAEQGRPLPPAGWYPDPHNTLYRRWWNGQAWTDQVQAVLRNQTRFTPTQQSAQSSQRGQAVRDSLRGLAEDLGGEPRR